MNKTGKFERNTKRKERIWQNKGDNDDNNKKGNN